MSLFSQSLKAKSNRIRVEFFWEKRQEKRRRKY